jgi:F-type H+-transporting ATPase subunit b
MGEIGAVFGINGKLLLIQSVNFGLLLLILWKFLYLPLVKVMGERQSMIEKGVKDAEKAEVKLSEIKEEETSILSSATAEGEKMVHKAIEQGKLREADLVMEANRKSERVIKDASLKAEEIKRIAHEESKAEVARVAVLAAEKILREKK